MDESISGNEDHELFEETNTYREFEQNLEEDCDEFCGDHKTGLFSPGRVSVLETHASILRQNKGDSCTSLTKMLNF